MGMEGIDGLIKQLEGIKDTIKEEEQRRDKLVAENAQLASSILKRKKELADHEERLDEVKRMLDLAPGDDVLCLDVGGRTFRMYRSTLTLFKDSVLATIASKLWTEEQQNQGALFLDMDPDSFDEIAHFLRTRRIDSSARSNFSSRATDLAAYLGIPIDHVKGMQRYLSRFDRVGERVGQALAFEVRLPHPARGNVTAVLFSVKDGAECKVFTKSGIYDGMLNLREEWIEEWTGTIEKGSITVPLSFSLKNGECHAIYIWCDKSVIEYSEKDSPNFTHQHPQLVCTRGRGIVGESPFQWPPPEQKAFLSQEYRYFSGFIEYTVYGD